MEHVSLWRKVCDIPARNPLNNDIKTDVAVIGAGMAGLLTAYRLQQNGVKTVVIDAEKIAGGVTQNTTAKITSQHNLIYDRLIKALGEDKARQYAQANQAAIKDYAATAEAEKAECDFKIAPAYVYSLEDAAELQSEVNAAQRLGINAEFTRKTELPFQVRGAVKFSEQAQFTPLPFIKAISHGLTVYERTRAVDIRKNSIITPHGTITADKIVFASHYPFVIKPGYYFLRMHQERSYVLALKNAPVMQGMYIDRNENGFSFRAAGDLLLLGGSGHRTGKVNPSGCYQRLQQTAQKFYPQAEIVASWSAQDCMTLDGIPYIGAFSHDSSDWLIATGFNKWGMTSSMVAARVLTDMIIGNDVSYAEVFSPLRINPAASAGSFIAEGAQAVSGLVLKKMQPASKLIDEIPLGHGGVVSYNGEKLGVYKSSGGECHFVSLKCPHLGCELAWNPEEKSWDCPCHGSRFDYNGNLIGGPAQENLTKAKD